MRKLLVALFLVPICCTSLSLTVGCGGEEKKATTTPAADTSSDTSDADADKK